MDGSRESFVRALRRHRPEDIQEAERRLRTAACRCQARLCDRYFVGILRNVSDETEQRRVKRYQTDRERSRRREDDRRFTAEQQALRIDPEYAIHRAYIPHFGQLYFRILLTPSIPL